MKIFIIRVGGAQMIMLRYADFWGRNIFAEHRIVCALENFLWLVRVRAELLSVELKVNVED